MAESVWGKLTFVAHATRSKQRCTTYHLADFEGHFVLSQSVCRNPPTDRSGNHDVAVPAQCSSSDRFDVLRRLVAMETELTRARFLA